MAAAGYSIWWDKELTGGARFTKETETKVNEAKAIVVAWSKSSIDSMWVADEAQVGRTKQNLVPIALDLVEPPMGFRQIHAIDFTEWMGEAGEPAFLSLNAALAGMLGREAATIAPARLTPLRRFARKIWKPPLVAAVMALVIAALILNRTPAGREFAVGPKSAIVVLPFINEGGARDLYLSEGFGGELRRQLSQVEGLKVIDDASSRALRGTTLAAPEIAARLNVGQLIEGALRREQGKLRISVQIVDGATGFQTWSQTYERAALDEVAVQKEIAAAVAVALTGRTGASAEIAPPASRDYSANDKMLLARHYEREVREAQVVDEAKLGRAIDLYREAAEADDGSALAHSRLAAALLYAGDFEAAEPEIKQAVAIDPNNSEVQYTLGLFNYARGLPGVGAAFERALTLNPNDADALAAYGQWSYARAPVAKTEESFRRARDLDPMSLRRYADLGHFYGLTAQRRKALVLVKEMTDRFSDPKAYSTIAQLLELQGDFDVAIAAAKKALSLLPQDEDIKAQLAELYAEIGDFDAAAQYEPDPGLGQLFWRRDYPRLIDLAEELVIDQPDRSQIWHMLAFAYSVEGDYEQALRALRISGFADAALQRKSTMGARVTMAIAFDGTGAEEEARKVAEFEVSAMEQYRAAGYDLGFTNVLLSCALAVLGRDAEAMEAFSQVDDGPTLPRLPWLKDYPCFKRFAADKRYTSVIAAVEKRQAELRARVAAMESD